MSIHSLYWLGRSREGIEKNSTQCNFLAASHLSNSDPPICPHHLDFFFLGTSGSSHTLYSLHVLHHALLCILPDGQGCSMQTSGKYCTQLPSGNDLPRGGWWLFQYSHLTWNTKGRKTLAPCQRGCWGTWGHHLNGVPGGWPWHGHAPSCTTGRNVHETVSAIAPGFSPSHVHPSRAP